MSGPDLIEQLVQEVRPVARLQPPLRLAVLWLALAWVLVGAVTVLTGPFRTGGLEDLLGSPRFALEGLVGFAVGVATIRAALLSGVPGASPLRRILLPAALILAIWVGLYAVGTLWPALPPSMAGKRPHCSLETLAFSLLPLAGAFWLMRRHLPLQPRITGFLLGLAAGSLPALLMQWACMYDPAHMLVNHLGPALGVALAGGVLGARLLPRA